mmetsp:Transcript_38483/g.116362  ORF Transcript_38483/g.116362 Transcript_38483/m.116362 type:complete len:225 (-) Transcript_38483:79-753(-)
MHQPRHRAPRRQHPAGIVAELHGCAGETAAPVLAHQWSDCEAEILPHVQHLPATTLQALLVLRQLRLALRSPLHMAGQLRRVAQLFVFRGADIFLHDLRDELHGCDLPDLSPEIDQGVRRPGRHHRLLRRRLEGALPSGFRDLLRFGRRRRALAVDLPHGHHHAEPHHERACEELLQGQPLRFRSSAELHARLLQSGEGAGRGRGPHRGRLRHAPLVLGGVVLR